MSDTEWQIQPWSKGDVAVGEDDIAELASDVVAYLVSDPRLAGERFRSCALRIEGQNFCAAAVADTKLHEASVYFTATFEEAREKNAEIAAFLGLRPRYRDGRRLS